MPHMPSEEFNNLLHKLKNNNPQCSEFVFESRLNNEQRQVLSDALQNNTSTVSVIFDTKAVPLMIKVLEANKNIRTLTFKDKLCSDQDIKALFEHLKDNKNIIEFVFLSKLSDESMKIVCEGLKVNRSIKSLSFFGINPIRAEQAKALSELFEVNHNICGLTFQGSSTIDDESIKYLISIILNNPTLTTVDIDGHSNPALLREINVLTQANSIRNKYQSQHKAQQNSLSQQIDQMAQEKEQMLQLIDQLVQEQETQKNLLLQQIQEKEQMQQQIQQKQQQIDQLIQQNLEIEKLARRKELVGNGVKGFLARKHYSHVLTNKPQIVDEQRTQLNEYIEAELSNESLLKF